MAVRSTVHFTRFVDGRLDYDLNRSGYARHAISINNDRFASFDLTVRTPIYDNGLRPDTSGNQWFDKSICPILSDDALVSETQSLRKALIAAGDDPADSRRRSCN